MVVILVLASLGILDAGYLSYLHLTGGQECGQGLDCSYVLSSSYSRFFGVPVSSLGLGVYLCLAFLALRAGGDTQRKADAVRWVFYISLTGNLLAAYLIYLQALVIRHWCPFCLLSTILMFSIFALSLWHRIVNKGLVFLLRVPNWSFGPTSMLSLLILPSVIFIGIEQAIGVISTNSINSITQDSEEVAQIGERKITLGEVNHGVRLGLNQIEWKRHELKLSWLENELLSMEAGQQDLSVAQLSKKNINDVVNVSDEETRNVYKANKKGPLAKIPYEKVKGKIAELLKAEKKRVRRQEYITQLKSKHNVSFMLPKPLSLVIDDNPRQGPERGPAEAAIAVVVFTDFECPFCAKAHKQINGFLARYPKDVRVVFRHFPLGIHKNALNAAYAAACAHLLGKFWSYADLLYKNQGKLGLQNLYDYAEQVGLDKEIFKQYMDTERGKEVVDADIAEGKEFGINSTPAFFFNGHFFKGLPKPKQIQLILEQYLPKPNGLSLSSTVEDESEL